MKQRYCHSMLRAKMVSNTWVRHVTLTLLLLSEHHLCLAVVVRALPDGKITAHMSTGLGPGDPLDSQVTDVAVLNNTSHDSFSGWVVKDTGDCLSSTSSLPRSYVLVSNESDCILRWTNCTDAKNGCPSGAVLIGDASLIQERALSQDFAKQTLTIVDVSPDVASALRIMDTTPPGWIQVVFTDHMPSHVPDAITTTVTATSLATPNATRVVNEERSALLLYIAVGTLCGALAGMLLLSAVRVCCQAVPCCRPRPRFQHGHRTYEDDSDEDTQMLLVNRVIASLPVCVHPKFTHRAKGSGAETDKRRVCGVRRNASTSSMAPLCSQNAYVGSRSTSPISVLSFYSDASEAYDPCAVCLEDMRYAKRCRLLPCGHMFHADCVDPWLRARQTCPLCVDNILASAHYP